MPSKIDNFSDAEFIEIVNSSNSIKDVAVHLGYAGHSGANGAKIKARMLALGLSTDRFIRLEPTKRTPENVFVENSTAAQKTLRKYYEEGNYTPYVCAICGQKPFWNGKPMILILDHINGKSKDDRLENLRWVCPNCNYQLDTTNSKNWVYQREHSN